jgi:biopolymer transport protein ExbD
MKLVSHLSQAGPALYLAPIINTVLLLLVFFFLGSTFLVQSGVPVAVPSSPSRLLGFDRADIITLVPGAEGIVYFNGEQTTISELQTLLKGMEGSARRAVIYADREVTYGRVMEVSSAAMAAGVEVALATTPEVQP